MKTRLTSRLQTLLILALGVGWGASVHCTPYVPASRDVARGRTPNTTVYTVTEVDSIATFDAGTQALETFLREMAYRSALHLQPEIRAAYPDLRGVLSLIIEPDGSVSHIRVERSISERLDREAIHILSLMPCWRPASLRGKPVRQRYYLPIAFLPLYPQASPSKI